jgi:Tol biopolymer transport system component/predicted Ser/Thr protein kinase
MIGSVISHYKILDKLGEGGMGVVYKAQDTKLDRFVALKFLPANVASSEADKARFMQEAKAASAMDHPNICPIYSIDEHEGQMFIAMQFVEGQTLREKMSTVSFKQAVDIGIQIADGLAAAHEKGIVHRDIKPENIMVRKDGICQIMDFGLAKLRGTKSKISRLTKEGSTLGTAGYMSPEQVQGQDVDHRSDIFSLGVLLYELFTGQLPFKGVHETALLYEIVNVDAIPMSAVKSEIDPSLDGIVLECLVKEPAERYQSVAEVAKELRRFKRESTRARATRTMTAQHYPQSKVVAPDVPAASSPSFVKRYLWHMTSLVLAIAVAVLAWSPWRVENSAKLPVMRFPIDLALTTPLVGGAATVAISPDGKSIVYLALSSGTAKLFLRPIDQFTGHVMMGTDGASDPFFSPNGEWVAFFSNGKLKKVSVFGGAPQDLCDIPGFMRGAWWFEDNTIWFGHINSTIYRVPASGGTPVEVTILDSLNKEISHRFPQPLPGGKNVLFTIKHSNISTFDEAVIATENIETHERKVLIRGGSFARYLPTGHVLYARGSAIYAVSFDLRTMEVQGSPLPVIEGGMLIPQSGDANFTVSQTGTLVYVPKGAMNDFQVRLVWYDRLGNRQPFLDSLRAYGDGTFSPDGQKLAMAIRAANDDIWVYQLGRGTLTRLTFGGGNSDLPIWTPDGKRVIYVSERGRVYSIFSKPWDGSGAEEKLGDADGIDGTSTPAISPDGKFIAFGKKGDIWIMPMEGERKSVPFIQSPAFELQPSFSRNGRWLSYVSNESGRSEVYVVPFPKRDGKWQISTDGGSYAWWMSNGKELVYLDGNTVTKVDVQIEPTFDFSIPHKMFVLPSFNGFLDATPDGKKFVFGDVQSRGFDVTQVNVVVNWFDELKKKFAEYSK